MSWRDLKISCKGHVILQNAQLNINILQVNDVTSQYNTFSKPWEFIQTPQLYGMENWFTNFNSKYNVKAT